MSLKKYLKNGVKYVLYDYKPQNIYIKPAIINSDTMFKDKVVLVTGGGSGIGLSIAQRFDSVGANVIITGRNEEKLKKAIKTMNNAIYYVNDITNISEQDSLLDFVYNKFNKIDVLVNNAGVSNHESDFLSVTEEDFDIQFNTNLKGAYFFTQNCIKRQLNNKEVNLNIIFISSERGSQCDFLPYGLTKCALNSLIEGLSCRFRKNNIRINGIAPGVTVSNFNSLDKNGNLQTDRYISGRYFVPEEISEIALFLASDYSYCISGEIIHCNLGNHLNTYLKK